MSSISSPTGTRPKRTHFSLAEKLPTVEDRQSYFANLGKRSMERRLVLSADEVTALAQSTALLAQAYALLEPIGKRAQAKIATQRNELADESA